MYKEVLHSTFTISLSLAEIMFNKFYY